MRKRRALVVEAELQVGLEIESTLRGAGFDVLGPVTTVEEAVQKVLEESFDVAVLDANLNGRKVGPAAESLIERRVPFVVVSEYAREHLPLALAHAPLIAKPFDPDSLISVVERLCRDSAQYETA